MRFQDAREFIMDKLTRELPKHLTYHSINHINDVYTSAQRLALLEGVTGEDLELLLTAVLFHDSGFTLSPKAHEDMGCQIARQYLPGFGYTEGQVLRICGMIMATMIPQAPHNLLEEIICDADLDYLGREDFTEIGNLLFRELAANGIVSNENDWNQLQVNFLTEHHYFTASAIKLRKAQKEEHLNNLKSIIN